MLLLPIYRNHQNVTIHGLWCNIKFLRFVDLAVLSVLLKVFQGLQILQWGIYGQKKVQVEILQPDADDIFQTNFKKFLVLLFTEYCWWLNSGIYLSICGDKIKIGKNSGCGRNVTIRDNNGGHAISIRGYKNSLLN